MRIAVAMSGGVDSAVAALLLHREGFDVVGMSMHLYNLDLPDTSRFDSCCSLEDLGVARRVAAEIGIPHFVVDYTAEFDQSVVRPFVAAYAAGETPNPCVWCNDRVKFRPLLKHARRLGCDMLATGHYARVLRVGDSVSLHRARDTRKDQSYFLFSLSADMLARTLFPVGALLKDEVRQIAEQAGLPVARKPESQDICFVPDGNVREFVGAAGIVPRTGRIVTDTGRELGIHKGIHGFTVGQRRGLGVAAGEPLYVQRIDAITGDVVVAPRERVLSECFMVRDVRWVHERPRDTVPFDVQVRYRSRPLPAEVRAISEDSAIVRYRDERDVAAPGQAAVFYEGDRVVGGGWISAPS